MGYYTFYDLEVFEYKDANIGAEVTNELILFKIREFLKQKDVIGWALEDDFCGHDQVEWCDHNDDMIELSKEFPNLIFVLHGDGEAGYDWWTKYYQNGRIQVCMATIPPFDPLELKMFK